jgi:hypothetical protein
LWGYATVSKKEDSMYRIFCIVGVLYLSFPATAHAYLDPGTGSMLLSMIVGVIASLWFLLKGVFYKIRGTVKKKNPTEQNASEISDIEEEPK